MIYYFFLLYCLDENKYTIARRIAPLVKYGHLKKCKNCKGREWGYDWSTNSFRCKEYLNFFFFKKKFNHGYFSFLFLTCCFNLQKTCQKLPFARKGGAKMFFLDSELINFEMIQRSRWGKLTNIMIKK
jgi:hypothetical protein